MPNLRKKLTTIAVAFVGCLVAIGLFVACEKTPETAPYRSYTCIVTFDAGYGTIHNVNIYSVEVEKGTTVPRPTEIPQRNGYVFWGWNATGSEDDPMWKFDSEKITQSITIHAVWVREYTVTFFTEEGAFDDGSHQYTVAAVYGAKITPPKLTPSDETRELQGWTTISGVEWDFATDTVPYGDLWLYAKWSLKWDIKKALAPFKYTKTDDGYVIDGVADKNVSGALTVPSIVTSIRTEAFSGCRNITSVIISDSVTEIGQGAFNGCVGLKSVTLPSGLTRIQSHAFYGCTALEQIWLPDTLTEVESFAFYGCTALNNINLGNVTKIWKEAFEHCSSLTYVQIPAVVEIGDWAFRDCTALKKITIPATCKSTGLYTFSDCTRLTSVELHCKAVDSGIFSGCSALADVTLGDEVVQLQSMAFRNFQGLRNVTIGDGLTSIPTDAFSYCYNLRNVTIGSGVKTISYNSFRSCHSLLSVTIPSNVTSIGSGVFTGCVRLVEIYNLSSASFNVTNVNYDTIERTDASDESIIHTTDDGFTFCMFRDADVYPYVQTPFLIDYAGDRADIVLPNSYNGDSYKIYKYALSHNPK
ncbi:MAG: leucine-rich repeat protein, partial [Clostridiales bacterium]|nr:leucine-rich repeat protein [Clostridiales bacterium]